MTENEMRDLVAAFELWASLPGEKRLHDYGEHEPDERYTVIVGGTSYGASSDYGTPCGVGTGHTIPEAIRNAALDWEREKTHTY